MFIVYSFMRVKTANAHNFEIRQHFFRLLHQTSLRPLKFCTCKFRDNHEHTTRAQTQSARQEVEFCAACNSPKNLSINYTIPLLGRNLTSFYQCKIPFSGEINTIKTSTSDHLFSTGIKSLVLDNIYKISGFSVTFLTDSLPFGDNNL